MKRTLATVQGCGGEGWCSSNLSEPSCFLDEMEFLLLQIRLIGEFPGGSS